MNNFRSLNLDRRSCRLLLERDGRLTTNTDDDEEYGEDRGEHQSDLLRSQELKSEEDDENCDADGHSRMFNARESGCNTGDSGDDTDGLQADESDVRTSSAIGSRVKVATHRRQHSVRKRE